MGSPEFAVPSLAAIHASSHEVLAVVSQPDRPSGRRLQMHPPAVKVAAQELGLRILQPETTRSSAFLVEMDRMKPDALVVVAYGEILRSNLLNLPPKGAINLHASLLPKYRGAAPIAWAILRGEAESGATTMLIEPAMDAGPVLQQATCPILPDDTTESLSPKISKLGASLLLQTLNQWEQGQMAPRPQDDSMATYAPKLKKGDGAIDWNRTAQVLERQVRAFHPWPGTFSTLEGINLKIKKARVSTQPTPAEPGTILEASAPVLPVACGEQTVLEIVELQPENKSTLTAADFIHGYRIRPGFRFKRQADL